MDTSPGLNELMYFGEQNFNLVHVPVESFCMMVWIMPKGELQVTHKARGGVTKPISSVLLSSEFSSLSKHVRY